MRFESADHPTVPEHGAPAAGVGPARCQQPGRRVEVSFGRGAPQGRLVVTVSLWAISMLFIAASFQPQMRVADYWYGEAGADSASAGFPTTAQWDCTGSARSATAAPCSGKGAVR